MAWRSFPQRVGKWLRRRFLVRTWKSQLERWTVIQETDRSQSQTRWAGLDSDRGGAAFRGGAPEAEPAAGSRGARHCVQTFATCRTPAAFLATALTLTYGRLVTLDRLAMAYPGYGGAVSPCGLRAASRCGGHPPARTVPAIWYQATLGLCVVLWSWGWAVPCAPGRTASWSLTQSMGSVLVQQWCEVFVICKFCFQNVGTEYHVLFQWPFVIYPQPKQFF